MDLSGKRLLIIGGAGLIGSHTVDALLREDVAEVRIFDNFVRGRQENLSEALADPRCNVFAAGGAAMVRPAGRAGPRLELACELAKKQRGTAIESAL